MVIFLPWVGNSGRWRVMSSSTASLPRSASIRMAALVNCLVMDPSSNAMSGWMGTPSSRFAMP